MDGIEKIIVFMRCPKEHSSTKYEAFIKEVLEYHKVWTLKDGQG